MVRLRARCQPPKPGSPHSRGDGPVSPFVHRMVDAFSPLAWGWSDARVDFSSQNAVLPTRVGMVRSSGIDRAQDPRSPHSRGDGPNSHRVRRCPHQFSPLAWGWSVSACVEPNGDSVLPTRVGMVRRGRGRARRAEGSPHSRGDGPVGRPDPAPHSQFSPLAWGWSGGGATGIPGGGVLPTRVGMVRRDAIGPHGTHCSPHSRGDGPESIRRPAASRPFSPLAWGWSVISGPVTFYSVVLPTRVGMVRQFPPLHWLCSRSPHSRGDGPDIRSEPNES